MNTNETRLTPKCAGAYRILHTADWHLGKQLMDQERHADHQRFLECFLSTVAEQSIDAVIISGDVFDGVNPPAKSEELYYTTLAALHGIGVAAVIISGNHDSPTMLRSASTIIGKLGHHIITDVPESGTPHIVLLPNAAAPRIAIAAIPYMREGDLRKVELSEARDDVRERVRTGWRDLYAAASDALTNLAPNIPAIATGHLTVTGGETNKDTEREIRIGGVGDVDGDHVDADGVERVVDRFDAGHGGAAIAELHRDDVTGEGVEREGRGEGAGQQRDRGEFHTRLLVKVREAV